MTHNEVKKELPKLLLDICKISNEKRWDVMSKYQGMEDYLYIGKYEKKELLNDLDVLDIKPYGVNIEDYIKKVEGEYYISANIIWYKSPKMMALLLYNKIKNHYDIRNNYDIRNLEKDCEHVMKEIL